MDKFALKIMCPDHVFFEGDATMVEFTTTQGNVGIYAKHIPMVNVIAPGKLSIDVNRAKEAKERAQKRLSQKDGIDVARAELALRRALVRLDVAGIK